LLLFQKILCLDSGFERGLILIAKDIIEKARKQGYLLKSEILEMLPNEADSPEGIELIFEMLRHMGIDVRD
jgi:hypothetical protein